MQEALVVWVTEGCREVILAAFHSALPLHDGGPALYRLISTHGMLRGLPGCMRHRCWLPGANATHGGTLGTAFPEPVKACLKPLAKGGVPWVMEHYGLIDKIPAAVLANRSRGEAERCCWRPAQVVEDCGLRYFAGYGAGWGDAWQGTLAGSGGVGIRVVPPESRYTSMHTTAHCPLQTC